LACADELLEVAAGEPLVAVDDVPGVDQRVVAFEWCAVT